MDQKSLVQMCAEDRLTFLIGRAVRLSVILEHRTRLVWGSLVEDTVAQYAMPSGTRDMHRAIEMMLPRIGLESEEFEACLAALKLTEQAHTSRHRMAHEQWFSHVPEAGDWRPVPRDVHIYLRRSQEPPSRTFEYFEAELLNLEDAIRRMSAMSLLVQMVYPSPVRRLLDPQETGVNDVVRVKCREMLNGSSANLPALTLRLFSSALVESVGLLEADQRAEQ